MAIRLTPELVLKAAFVVLLLIWALLWATGCAAAQVDEMPVTGVAVETASPTTTAGDDAVITNISFGSVGCMALVSLLGLLAWRHRTAVGALDRIIREIQDHEDSARDGKRNIEYETIRALQGSIEAAGGRIVTYPDRVEICIRSRVARFKK